VLEAIRQAAIFMQEGRVTEKGQMLGKAVRIVEEGLKASLDRSAGGRLAQQLASLYDYASLRLLQANLRNDAAALTEVARLLGDLRGAWEQIGKPVAPASVGQVAAAVPADALAVAAPARLKVIDESASTPTRRFAVSA